MEQRSYSDVHWRKRNLALDLSGGGKRHRAFSMGKTPSPNTGGFELLSSPDLEKFALTTPDVEKFLQSPISFGSSTGSNGSIDFLKLVTKDEQDASSCKSSRIETPSSASANTFTPNTLSVSSSFNTGSTNTYSRVETGAQLTKVHQLPGSPSTSSNNESYYYDVNSNSSNSSGRNSSQKENHEVLSSDDEDEESIIKLAHRRELNRLAASKCRDKKLKKIADLDMKKNQQKAEIEELENLRDWLLQQVELLKSQIKEEIKHGCPIVIQQRSS